MPARLTGETKTDAVTKALRSPGPGPARAQAPASPPELDDLARQCASLPVLDRRSDDEILGYDSTGTPG